MVNNRICQICGSELLGPSNQKYCNASCREKKDKESFRISWFRGDSRSKGLSASLTIEQWLATLHHFEWACAYCQKPFVGLDHFVPTALGGGTTVGNCVPCCMTCNTVKGYYHPDEVTTIPHEAIRWVRAFLASFCTNQTG